jgi:hypothetical protein
MTVPPNTLAALSIWTTVWLSAKSQIRAPFIISAAVVAIIGVHRRRLDFSVRVDWLKNTQGYIILISTKTRTYDILCRWTAMLRSYEQRVLNTLVCI